MAEVNMTKDEIQNWIDFLYADLLNDNIYIGGYYFSFKQLPEFEILQSQIDEKIDKILSKIKVEGKQLVKDDKNSSCRATQRAQNRHFEELDRIIVKVTPKNKYNEIVSIPCNQDEFHFVYEDLKEAREDVEHFHSFLTEELQNVAEEDLTMFMTFINDLLEDTRKKFSTGSHSIII